MATALAPYRDPGRPLDERAADLLTRMTLDEKLAQLGSVWSFELFRTEDELDPVRMRDRLGEGIGQVSRVAGATNLDPVAAARAADAIQRFLVEETRLGIPAILHEETLHGLLARDAVTYQQSIGAAAAFDPELVEAIAVTIRRRMRAIGARLALAPVLDLCRDPRWGRVEETYGEDPYLATELGVAYTRGLQGDDIGTAVAATAKHFVGHGLSEGGLNQAPVHAGWRELRDEQLVPFEAAVRVAGLAAVMPAYCDVDGVPCHASRELLTRILREEWAFDGIVAADYTGVQMLVGEHQLTDDLGDAAARSLGAGLDSELPTTVALADPARAAIADGRLDPAVVDRAVERVLRLKLRLGLFERPYAFPIAPDELADLAAEEARLARRLATQSLVLVENDGVLPLDDGSGSGAGRGPIAVVGPLADSARDLLGDYAHQLHIETLAELRHRANPFGFPPSDVINPRDEQSGRPTILDAIRARFGTERVVHERGCGIRDGSDAELAAAVDAASRASVAIVVAGERSGLTEDATTGEARDRRDLGLLGRQQELLEAVVATGTPTVLIVVSGRPLALPWAAEHCAAVLLSWVPGDAGPAAIASVLAGDADPGGRLPVTVPRHVGQVPLTYRHHPTGGRSNWKVDHVDGPAGPLWPFGHGRSYTTFAIDHLRIERGELATQGDTLTASVDVTNTGRRAGDEVVQLYVRDVEATVARPVLELRGFRRVRLAPGECRTVTFEVSTEQLSHLDADYRRVVEPGRIRVHVGRSVADLPWTAEVRLVGPTADVRTRDQFVTRTRID
ncbi:MAG TPA: glycoside hydrolase family 3 N-terminal domain-containing protein [Candidatus Limnocylindrales bacterium]|nr:glycoside hydrolase family 3 N-terminal domain-containing protein [Candidatus Limnocylindrales bacterium]